MQKCPGCNQEFPPEAFATKKGHRHYNKCPACRRAEARNYMKKHRIHEPEAIRRLLIDACGSQCNHCRYNKYPESLEFHHIGYSISNISMLINRFTYYPTPKLWATILRNLHRSTILCKSCRYALRLDLWKDSSLKPLQVEIEMPSS